MLTLCAQVILSVFLKRWVWTGCSGTSLSDNFKCALCCAVAVSPGDRLLHAEKRPAGHKDPDGDDVDSGSANSEMLLLENV